MTEARPAADGLTLTAADLLNARVDWRQPHFEPVYRGNDAGSRRSRMRGNGAEFDTTAPFEDGDDSRHIDWNATARTGQIQVRRYFHETQRPVVIAVDGRKHMYFGTRDQLLAGTGFGVAAALTWLFQRSRRPFAMIGIDEQAAPVSYRVGTRARLQSVQWLCDKYERGIAGLRRAGSDETTAELASDLRRWQSVLRPQSDLILVSDYSDLGAAFADTVGLSPAVSMHAVVIEDGMIRQPFKGRFPLTSSRGDVDDSLTIGMHSRSGFFRRVGHWRETLDVQLRRAGMGSVHFCDAYDLQRAQLR